MTTKVAPLGLRLFMEGVEVPVISAQVSAQPDRPATASIQVIPSEMGLHFLPRTLVHLFYLDPNAILSDPNELPRQTEDAELGTPLNRFDALDSQYRLMYVGEVIGFNYGKTPSSRQLVLQCMDLSSYWDTCYQWFADYSVGGSGLTDRSQNFLGAGTSQFNSISGGHQWVIGRLINTKPKSSEYQDAQGLLGGILHLLEAIGGIRYKSSGEPGFRGVNDFFTVAELRYNLLGMIGAVEKDETSAKLYANKAFRSWLRNGMTSLGTMLSFRDIINHVNKHIFHNIYPNPCAFFRQGDETTRLASVEGTLFTDGPAGRLVEQNITDTVGSLNKGAASFRQVSLGSNIDPILVSNFTEGARLIVQADKSLVRAEIGIQNIQTDDKSDVIEKLKSARSDVDQALLSLIDAGYDQNSDELEIGGGNLQSIAGDIEGAARTAADVLQFGVLGQKARARKQVQIDTNTLEGSHLFNQLLLPELFFVAPPRCNVVFPDQYSQFSFSRNFMREVSRLMCRGGLGMIAGGRRGAKLLGRHYYAPTIRDSVGKLLFATMGRGARVLLPHEVHSGIIPKFEWVTDGHRWAIKAAKETGTNNKFTQGGKVGYVQRLANFQFYMHRFSARSISVTGLFNPNIVLGFPGLVIDRSMPAPVVAKKLKELFGRRWLPQQYLGKMETFSHNITQSGGQTSFTMTKCRTHRGLDDEFLGTLTREIATSKVIPSTRRFITKNIIKASSSAKVRRNREEFRKLMETFVRSKNTIPVGTKAFANKARVVSSDFSNIQDFFNISELRKMGITEDLATDTNSAGDPGLNLPRRVVIKFEFGSFEILTDANIEEALTPGWYSEVWKNENIGKDVYGPLLNTGAITDEVTLGAREQDELLDQLFEEEVRTETESGDPSFAFADTASFSEVEGATISDDSKSVTVTPGSIEEAIDALVLVYSLIRRRGADVHQFIADYTRRDIATIEDILGSKELFFDDSGNIDSSLGPDVREGFHSRAFEDYNTDVKFPTREGEATQAGKDALHVLYPGVAKGVEVTQKSILDRGEPPTAILPELDPRGRARARVLAYAEELSISRGLLG